ncbi:MAG: amino acid permease [Rubricoccaceae bacterium]|nr:amino acid permease [Rubricoccaceae bacterium]
MKGSSPPVGLKRGLTLVPTAALIVTSVIGSGVFVKARVMTCNVGEPGLVLLAYAVAGVFTLAGALTFAELGAMLPRAGGGYNYVGAAFGRFWAFLTAWGDGLRAVGASGALAVVFAIFFNDLVGGTLTPLQAKAVAVVVIIALTALALAPVRENGVVATVVTGLKVALVLGVGVAAFAFGDGTWAHFGASGAAGACEGVPASARLGVAGFGAAILGALWSYSGWTFIAMLAEEVRAPGRTLPRALIGATVFLIGLYVLVNAGYFFALSPEAVASVPETSSVASAVLVRLIGAGGAAVLAAGLLVSTGGTLHAGLLARARVLFALARDGLLPRALAALSRRARAPFAATLTLGGLALVAALSGTFDLLTDLAIFITLLFNGLAVASVYRLRRRLPDAARPYRVWGYPVVPALFLLASAYLIVNTLIATPGRALAGLGLVALGLPVYAYYARRLPPSRPEDWLGDGPSAQPEGPSSASA